jgi:hypothetical protein
MSRDRPQAAGDELFVVLLGVFSAFPDGLLVVCKDFEDEGAREEAECGVIANRERGMDVRRQDVDHVYRETDE